MLGPTHRKAGLIFRDADSQGMKAIDSGRKRESDDEERNHRGVVSIGGKPARRERIPGSGPARRQQ